MKIVRIVALLLVIVGAIHLGFMGLFNYDLIGGIFGKKSAMTHFIFDLIGIAGIYSITFLCHCIGCGCGTSCSCFKKKK